MQTREWNLYEDAIFCVYSRIALKREGSGAAARGDPDPSKNITVQRTHHTQSHTQGITLIHTSTHIHTHKVSLYTHTHTNKVSQHPHAHKHGRSERERERRFRVYKEAPGFRLAPAGRVSCLQLEPPRSDDAHAVRLPPPLRVAVAELAAAEANALEHLLAGHRVHCDGHEHPAHRAK